MMLDLIKWEWKEIILGFVTITIDPIMIDFIYTWFYKKAAFFCTGVLQIST